MSVSAWNPRNIYLYLVCLITLVIAIFATVSLVRAVVDLVYPEPVMEVAIAIPTTAPAEELKPPQPAPEELRAQQEHQRRWTVRRATLDIVANGALLALAGPLYLYHWRKIQREAAAR